MAFNQISQVVEFLANIITILGFLGIGYIYKIEIYNKKYITYIIINPYFGGENFEIFKGEIHLKVGKSINN